MTEGAFGKYRLIAELGQGGMADVFLAMVAGPAGSGFSKLTVIKRLRQNLVEDPEFVAMLVDEARIAARLNHPNVVQTNEVGQVDNQYFIAMEYLDGQPLHRIQQRVALARKRAKEGQDHTPTSTPGEDPFPKALEYWVLLNVLEGLHHAHELADYDGTPLQIVHRDVTPHNIFVTYEGQVKVVDFGIAKSVGRASETQHGTIKGKVRYMAPEQAIGTNIDRRADLYSVGVMLWEAVVGRRMWGNESHDMQILQELVGGSVNTSPRDVDPTVPEALDEICRKALAYEPDERYQTAEEFRLALEQYLIETGQLTDSRRKLGPVVSNLFKDKRAQIRELIEQQIALMKSRASTELIKIPSEPHSNSTLSPTTRRDSSVLDDPATQLYDSARLQVATRGSRKRAAFVVGGLGVLGLLIFVFASGNRKPEKTGPTESHLAPPVTTPTTTTTTGVTSVSTTTATSASVTVDADLSTSHPTTKQPIHQTYKGPITTGRPHVTEPSHTATENTATVTTPVTVTPPTTVTAPPNDCAVPFTIDSTGIRHPKPSCN